MIWTREWRWRRAYTRRAEYLGGDRVPVQVCPRGCEHTELARRDSVAKTRLTGRATMRVKFIFETENCPKCGVRLASRCPRCAHEIFAPVVDRCQACGLPQPWAFERREAVERTSIRLWHRSQEDTERRPVNDPALPLYLAPGRGDLWVIDGDISRLSVDAVVANDDVHGQMWADVARAIKVAAGEGVEVLAQANQPYALGHAWRTSAGALERVQGIIHVATMTRNGKSSTSVVEKALRSAFEEARKAGYASLGIGAMGSGPAAIPTNDWFRAFARVSVRYLSDDTNWASESGAGEAGRKSEKDKELSVVLVLFEPSDLSADVRALRSAFMDAWDDLGRPRSGEPIRVGSPTRRKLWRLRRLARRLVRARRAAFRRVRTQGEPSLEHDSDILTDLTPAAIKAVKRPAAFPSNVEEPDAARAPTGDSAS
jgi:O-acetyl-ADP-ribose deacetylase (regulator of RNase III)